jgi:hypothetical protein
MEASSLPQIASSLESAKPPTSTNRRTHEVKVVHLRTEYRENPLGIDSAQPRLSWQLQSEARGTAQTAYQVRVFAF